MAKGGQGQGRGATKPSGRAKVVRSDPLSQGLLLLVPFDGSGTYPEIGKAYSGTSTGGPTVITSGACAQRRSVVSHNLSTTDTWSGTREGMSLSLGSKDAHIDLGDASFIPSKNVTICVIRRIYVNNLNPGWGFKLTNTAATHCACTFPFSDGQVHWGFGSTGALVTSGLTLSVTEPERWIFQAGDPGMSLWRNGIQVASSTTPVSRTVSTADNLWLNGNGANTGYQSQWNYFAVFGEYWPAAKCRWWSAMPYANLTGSVVSEEIPALAPVAPASGATFATILGAGGA